MTIGRLCISPAVLNELISVQNTGKPNAMQSKTAPRYNVPRPNIRRSQYFSDLTAALSEYWTKSVFILHQYRCSIRICQVNSLSIKTCWQAIVGDTYIYASTTTFFKPRPAKSGGGGILLPDTSRNTCDPKQLARAYRLLVCLWQFHRCKNSSNSTSGITPLFVSAYRTVRMFNRS